jgi:hypothetical protein
VGDPTFASAPISPQTVTTVFPWVSLSEISDDCSGITQLERPIDDRCDLSGFGLGNERPQRIGTANGSPMSVHAGAFHIAGHEFHHLDSIEVNYGGGSRP